MLRFILIIGCLSSTSQLCFGQTFYYVRNEPYLGNPAFGEWYLNCFDVNNCQDTTIVHIDTSGIGFPMIVSDLAICPNGNYYVSLQNTLSGTMLAEVNPQTGSVIPFDTLPNSLFPPYIITALVCGEDNVLYGSGGGRFYSYDLLSATSNDYGFITPYPISDLTFRDGVIFATTATVFLQIILNPPVATVIDSIPEILIGPTCLATELISCDSQITYLTVPEKINLPNQVFWLNPMTLDTGYLCDMPYRTWGIATNEFKKLDCTVRLNLDPDTSSNAPPTDWQSLPLCAPGSLIVADTDATYYSGYHTDSIRIRLLAPAPDSPLEYLTATAFGSVGVSGQGTGWLRLAAASSTAVVVANIDYQSALRSVLWHNDAPQPTPGLRTVEVIAFASGNRTDTSYAYLPVQSLFSAGQDTTFSVCADAAPFSVLSPASTAGGVWSPTLAGGVFSPQSDLPGTYSYTIENGLCPADTAYMSLEILPLPVFSLGQDTNVCINQLPLPLAAAGISLWQDGSSSALFTVIQSGVYWAELTDANGCRFRDSIFVSALPSISTSGAVQSCYGQSYNWNGQNLISDTTVCASFTGLNGCDSTHCLSLTFFYPALTLDTSICSGQVFTWMGNSYATAGDFIDTVLNSGCLTVINLHLNVRPQDTVTQSISICNGENYTIGGQTFSTSGQYYVTVQSVASCDTVLRLDLQVRPPIETVIMANICPGDQYVFGIDTLTIPGNYTASIQTVEGCDSTLSLSLELLIAPTPQITGDTSICNAASITLSAGFFAAYLWSEGTTTANISVSTAGLYSVMVTAANGCTAIAETDVSEFPPIVAAWIPGNPLCHGDSTGFIELTNITGGIEPILFSLNGGTETNLPIFEALPAGAWEIFVTDAAACTASFLFTLDDPPALAVELGTSPELEVGDTYSIPVQANQSGVFNYAWSPPDGLDCANCPNPVLTAFGELTYILTLSSASGCKTSDSLHIRIKKVEQAYIPNIFSPDKEGENAWLTVYGNPAILGSVDLFQIFDRWGELIFETQTLGLNDEQSGWDGTLRGRPVLPGVYVWHAEIRLVNGTLLLKSGEVTVIR